ncbi:hypothetical protein C7974DRAFT_178031 [Boeremia exigua]|uniref:uncharacterized protein n=1 Tax=Boeremia exigua TaxID=749465 RepID=UPI001E8D7E6A|nr:uncharacterized protein C7974DRAFT_178031 [Boeremia exigua]KAH6633779.1 hypothetical protein C7974DRAFT_178031 [Boeremia exigua]
MLLLDLPPELFQRIIGIHATTVSARRAARAREVSKTFRDYINEELFARQSVSKFKAREGKRLLKKNLALFLSYRAKALHGAPGFLPELIHATVEKLVDFVGSADLTARTRWTETVTQVIARRYGSVNAAIAPYLYQLRDLKDDRISYTALAVALYARDTDVAAAMIGAGMNPWDQSCLFSCAIYITTEVNDLHILKMLLSAADKLDMDMSSESRKKLQYRTITRSIHNATHAGYWDVAVLLLVWGATNIKKPPCSTVKFWMERAAAADGLDFLDNIRKLGYIRHSISNYAHCIIRGLLRNPMPDSALRFCIRNGLLNEHNKTSTCKNTSYHHLLNLAVLERNILLAKAALAVNAYADQPAALRTAISLGDTSMVRFLLDSGVDPEGLMHPPVEKTTCELAEPDSEVYHALKSAIHKKMQRLGTNYRPPHQVVRTSKKDPGVYVAYTFHAPRP